MRAIAVVGLLFSGACSVIATTRGERDAGASVAPSAGDGGAIATPDLAMRDGSAGVTVTPDLAPIVCAPACGANQACNDGTCEDLPNSCPCPMGAYCDLATNACKAGCLADSDCSAGDYCDTTARQCKPGCRSTSDCPNQADVCQQHVCANNCGSCDDDNNCTNDSCVRNQCVHAATNNGGACPDDGNVCTSDVCAAGACTHPAVSDGKSCPDDGNGCTRDICTGGQCAHPSNDGAACADDGNVCTNDVCMAGACTHPNVPDNTFCGDIDPASGQKEQFCRAGTCTEPFANCDCSDGYCLVYSETDFNPDSKGCSCNATTQALVYGSDPNSPDDTMACGTCGQLGGYTVCWASNQ